MPGRTRCSFLHRAATTLIKLNSKIGGRIEHYGKRIECDGRWLNRNPARSNLFRSGSDRRIGRGPFQSRLVWVGPWRETRSEGPGLLEVARYLQAALLGRVVGYSVR